MSISSAKKILIILSHTGAGGDSQVILNLLHAVRNSDFEFHILPNTKGAIHTDFKQFAQVYTFPVDEIPFLRRVLRRFFKPVYVFLKKQYCHWLLSKIKPDLVYLNTINEHEFSQVAVGSGIRFAVHIHEMGFVVTQRMRDAWMEQLLRKSTMIVSPAHAVTDFYQDVYGADPGKITVLHETVNDKRLNQNIGKGFAVTPVSGNNAFIVGGSGAVIFRKGVDIFINTCSILHKLYPGKVRFVWLGGQPEVYSRQLYYQSLQKRIKQENLQEVFQFLPYTAHVGDFFRSLDVMLLSSRMEAFPLVVLEAMLFETPVVAMDVGGVREVVDEETGYLVKDQTPEGMAAGLLHFMKHPELGNIAGKKGRERVLENFEAEVQVKKWLHILHTLTHPIA